MHKSTFIPILASLITLSACQPDAKDIGTTESAGEPTTSADTTVSATEDPDSSDSGAADTIDTGPTTGAGETTAPETTGPTETTGTAEECACIVDDEGGGSTEPALPTCAESLCAIVEVDCGPDCVEFSLKTPEALTCALEALRARTPGLLRWSLNADGSDDEGYVLIRADGSAIRRNWGWEGLSYIVAPAQIVALLDSEAYAQCLGDASDQARFHCLSQSLANERDPVCDEGWQTEGI